MSDTERDSQLSAMFDGELPAAECELVARRLARDPRLKRQWASYSLIGAVIRGEPLQAAGSGAAGGDSRLARRVAQAIASESTQPGASADAGDESASVPPAAANAPHVPRWQRPVAGLGIAAAVAGLAVFGLQFRGAPSPGDVAASGDVVVVGAAPLVAAAVPMADEVVIPVQPSTGVVAPAPALGGEPESYVVPVAGAARAAALPSPQLANFVVAHSEYSAPWARRNLLSSILASEQPAQGVDPAASGTAAAAAPTPAAGVPAAPDRVPARAEAAAQ